MNFTEKSKIDSITMLRGLACLAVCFKHFAGTVGSHSLNQIAQYGGYGVPIFFAISGFILPYSMEKANYVRSDYLHFLLKRTIRLQPPYILSIIGIFALSFLAQFSKFHTAEMINPFSKNTLLNFFYLVDFFDGK